MEIAFTNGLKNCQDGCPFIEPEILHHYDHVERSIELVASCKANPCRGFEVVDVVAEEVG